MKFDSLLLLLLIPILFASCARRNIAYLDDLVGPTGTYEGRYTLPPEYPIRTGDLLAISVNSASPESDIQFNPEGEESETTDLPEYQVDADGTINFPVLGRIEAVGRTKGELARELTDRLETYLQEPDVYIRLRNMTVTVLGEVQMPSTFVVDDERITVLQALGLAGDLTPYGKRDDVIVIRETNGVRTAARLDLGRAEILNSPYYFLQPNDVVYVEPVRARAEQASLTRSNISIGVSILSAVVFLIVAR
jgi:polysaccharide export outer membrane protein